MNFIVLVIDSLRADHLSLYGYPRLTSPVIDELGRGGKWFPNFFTVALPTLPACTSLLSGQFPLTHRVLLRKGGGDLQRRAPWLPEILARHGYATAAVDNLIVRKPWFARGFEEYMNPRLRGDEYLSSFQFNRVALRWLARQGSRPFFLYLRYGDTHTPYNPPAPYRGMFYAGDPPPPPPRSLRQLYTGPLRHLLLTQCRPGQWPTHAGPHSHDLEWCRSQYDAEIRAADDGLAELVDGLRALGRADDTTLIILGDHGESLGEHGIYFDHHGLYECTLRPPLIIASPAATGPARIDAVTQMTDVCPTILELAGLDVPATVEGRSLAGALAGRSIAGWKQVVACECTLQYKWAVRRDGWKLILSRSPDLYGNPLVELYDLEADPDERSNLAEDRPEVRERMAAEFEEWLASRLVKRGYRLDPVALEASARRFRQGWRVFRDRVRWSISTWMSVLQS